MMACTQSWHTSLSCSIVYLNAPYVSTNLFFFYMGPPSEFCLSEKQKTHLCLRALLLHCTTCAHGIYVMLCFFKINKQDNGPQSRKQISKTKKFHVSNVLCDDVLKEMCNYGQSEPMVPKPSLTSHGIMHI